MTYPEIVLHALGRASDDANPHLYCQIEASAIKTSDGDAVMTFDQEDAMVRS